MNDLINKFREFQNSSSYTRVSANHKIELYYGKDDLFRNSLLLLSDYKPKNIESTKIINVEIKQRDDNKWLLVFALDDNKFIELFCCFCEDIINSTEKIEDEAFGTGFICDRYLKWQNMLKKQSLGILSFSEIKGLLGELIFLKDVLSKEVGYEKAINSWTGPYMTDQDFYLGNTWYEIKSTTTGSEKISISSVEQLDSNIEGCLIVVSLDKTSIEDSNKINLNAIINLIKNEINDYFIETKFTSILLEKGYYYVKEYDEINFKLNNIDKYKVDRSFPCLRNKNIPDTIINIKYDLLISSIQDYKVGE